MKGFKKIIGSFLLTMGLATGLAFHAAAATKVTIDGVILESDDTPAAVFPLGVTEITAKQNVKSTVDGVQFENKVGIFADTVDGAVIRPVLADGSNRADLFFGLMITNGTVTIDLTGIGDAPIRLATSIWVRDAGRLVIKGRDAIDWGYVDSTSAVLPAAIYADEIFFVDADGIAYAEPGTINFTGSFTEVKMPTNINWTVAEGAHAYLHRQLTPGVVSRYAKDGVLTLDTFDISLMDTVGLDGISFKVCEGRKLRFLPRTPVHQSGILFNGNSRDCAFVNDIVLDGGELVYGFHHNVTHTGDVSGAGTVRYSCWNASTEKELTTVSGALTFSGDFIMECTAAKNPRACVLMKQATPGASGNTVTLGAGCTLRLEPAVAGGGSIASLTGPGTLSLGKVGLTILSAPTGDPVITGAGADVTTVIRGWPLEPGEVFRPNAEGAFLWELAPQFAAEAIRLSCSNGFGIYCKPADPLHVDLSPVGTVGQEMGEVTLTAADGVEYVNVPSNVTVVAESGVTATVRPARGEVVSVRPETDANIVVGQSPVDWQSAISLRFDFSTAEYTIYEGNKTFRVGTIDYPVGDFIYSTSGTDGPYYLRNDKAKQTGMGNICPIVMTNALNGKTYLSCADGGNNRRAVFWDATAGKMSGDTGAVQFRPKFAVMVFGSQRGGGAAVLGNYVSGKGHAYLRDGWTFGTFNPSYLDNADKTNKGTGRTTSATQGIFGNDAIDCWIDGTKVAKPSEQGLNSGWQIISVDTTIASVDGLGFVDCPSSSTDCGGQNYAETIFFDRVLTDLERVEVERYLAEKWGISTYVDSGLGQEPVKIAASGKGTVTLESEAELTAGSFRGAIVLNGRKLSVGDDPQPPTSEAVTGGAIAPLRWFDPELTDTSHMDISTPSEGTIVNYLYDVRTGKVAGESYLNSAGRSPLLVSSARGDGETRNWLDFSPLLHGGATANGRSYRFNVVGSGKDSKTIDGAPSARTVIMAQDSVKSGGTPFMDTIAGSTLSQRNPAYATNGETTYAKPIWVGKSVGVFQDGATYLNGVAVDGSVAGFTGGPEILTAVGGANFTLGDFGNLYYLNGRNPNDIDAGEIMGEILIYGEVLSDAQRKAVEAYLSWKWCGQAINGYAVHANTTITGAGTVTVASLDQMPQFAAGFTGTADLSAISELAFTIDPKAGTVDGAIVNPGTLAFPAAVTAKVSFASRMKAGKYALVTAAAGLDRTTWTLDLGVDLLPDNVKLNVTATKVELEVQPLGMMMLVR